MSRNDKSSVSQLQNDQHKKILTSLLREEGNRRCADCFSRGPTWASVNLGVFVCLNCSGIHRSLGVHISKVRSTNLDTWLPEQVAFVQAMGNVRCNAFWEANLPRNFQRPLEADMGPLRVFIVDKYVNKRYALKGYSDSPCIENYASHPFLSEYNAARAEVTAAAAAAAAAAPPPQPPAVSKPTPPAPVTAPPPPPPPPQPAFDLLSLDDDPVNTSSSGGGGGGENGGAPPTAASWDPFAALSEQRDTTPDTVDSAPSTTTTTAGVPAVIDPFAEIERIPSRSSTASSVHGTTNESLRMDSLENGTTTNTGATADPFSMFNPPPPSSSSSASAAPSSGFSNNNLAAFPPPLPPSSTTTAAHDMSLMMGVMGSSGGVAPMRAASGSVHSKGSLSHDDIMAMFDKPAQSQAVAKPQ